MKRHHQSNLLAAVVALSGLFGMAWAGDQAVLTEKNSATHQSASNPASSCVHPPYKIHLLSKSPLVIYIEDFITPDERLHLQGLTHGRFKHSAVQNSAGGSAIHSVRTSQSTSVERDDVVRCIEARALEFQGFDLPESHLEPIQLVKYAPTEHYHFHTDWFTDASHTTASLGGNRLSSFFGYVKADNVTGGGTNFPMLDAPRDERWCRFLDCDDEYEAGVTVRPIEGNAVYWENLLSDGRGDERVLHAGLPVVGGEKIGMNIWTRQAPLSAAVRGL